MVLAPNVHIAFIRLDLFSSCKIDASNSCPYPDCPNKYAKLKDLVFHLVTSHGKLAGKIPSKDESRTDGNDDPHDQTTQTMTIPRKCYKCNIWYIK
jgi:hypothetical protein